MNDATLLVFCYISHKVFRTNIRSNLSEDEITCLLDAHGFDIANLYYMVANNFEIIEFDFN